MEEMRNKEFASPKKSATKKGRNEEGKRKWKERHLKVSTLYKDWQRPKEDLELEDHKVGVEFFVRMQSLRTHRN